MNLDNSSTFPEKDLFYLKELDHLKKKGNLRYLPEIIHEGKLIYLDNDTFTIPNKKMINLSSNDYLGIGTDSELQRLFIEQFPKEDFLLSASSARLMTGNFIQHRHLESQLANLYNAESALIFSSGYHANIGILPAVSDRNTLILADKLVHASLIDGIRLSPAEFIRYPHGDIEKAEALIKKHQSTHSRIILVTESIFSMDGDEAPLQKLVSLKRKYPQLLLYVDEAHAVGVRGAQGLGCAEEAEVLGEIDFLCGTFGKAFGSVGAYLICRQVIRDYLINKARSFIFNTALPPLNIAWTSFVLDQIYSPRWVQRRQSLSDMAQKIRRAASAQGYLIRSTSHIIPLVAGKREKALEKAEKLRKAGFYALAVRPPTVPEGTSRVRISLTAALEPHELEELIIAIQRE